MKNRITCESFNVSWDRNGTGAGFKASCTAARSAAAARRSKPRAPSGRRPQHAARARRPIISFQMRRSLPVLERPAHRRGLARAKAASPRGRPAFHVERRRAYAGGSELSPRPWEQGLGSIRRTSRATWSSVTGTASTIRSLRLRALPVLAAGACSMRKLAWSTQRPVCDELP